MLMRPERTKVRPVKTIEAGVRRVVRKRGGPAVLVKTTACSAVEWCTRAAKQLVSLR